MAGASVGRRREIFLAVYSLKKPAFSNTFPPLCCRKTSILLLKRGLQVPGAEHTCRSRDTNGASSPAIRSPGS